MALVIDIDVQIKSFSSMHLPTLRSKATTDSEKYIVFIFSHIKA